MTNSYELHLLGLYRAIITDCEVRYPHLHKDFTRDFSRLLSCVETRGLSFLTIDLVDFGKHFDRCLSTQRLTLSSLPFQRGYKRGTPIPRLFKGLMLRVFDTNGILRSDCDVHAITCLRQLYYTAKKIRMECSNERSDKAVREFYSIESQIRRGSDNWFLEDPDWGSHNLVHLGQVAVPSRDVALPLFEEEAADLTPSELTCINTIQDVADITSAVLGVFNPYAWKAKHGPGAVSDARSGTSKYSFPHWPRKLERVFPYADFAFANYGAWARRVSDKGDSAVSQHEPPSNLILVPKTQKSPRLIASEPISHQWCQQVIKDYFVGRTRDSWIGLFVSFRDQEPNQIMARRGSLGHGLSTIDLSEASDRVSTWLVERIFRRNSTLLDALHATRTRTVKNGTEHGTRGVSKLQKFSCMGSACTFPVQTIVFLIIALGVYLHQEGLKPTIRNIKSAQGRVRTFGDDIIVPDAHADMMIRMLTLMGLRVNHSKTFLTGMFRESCGLDVFRGTNVSPVYSMTYVSAPKPESISSVVETHNNFLVRGWYNASDYLASTVRSVSSKIRNVAIDSGDFGLKTVGYVDNTHLERRVNPHLQRLEVRAHVVCSTSARTRDQVDSMILQYFTEEPPPTTQWKAGISSRSKLSLKLRWVDAACT